jgi:dTDP-4-amino-4,6-dideoxygalactose transaminase
MTTAQQTIRPDRSMTVPFAECWIHPSARDAAVHVLESGWLTTGREVQAFEPEFAAAVGAAHAVAVSSCTIGLELAFRSLHLRPGAKVLVSTLTFCGAVHAIIHAGLQPVLVDVDPVIGMPSEDSVRAATTGCGGADALCVVHWAGDPCDVEALAAAADVPLSRVVEDAAHAVGTRSHGRPVGAGPSAATVFSFYATKNLPIGEGGMITTQDEERAEWLRRARLHGMSTDAWRRYLPGGAWRYDVTDEGLKANLTDLQAAIGRAQLRQVSSWQLRRASIAARYDVALSGLPLGLPHRPDAPDLHAWHLYPVRIDPSAPASRDDVIKALARHSIGASVHFIPIHRLQYFARTATTPTSMVGADTLFERLVSLPMYPRLTDRQVDAVCLVLEDTLRGAIGVRFS